MVRTKEALGILENQYIWDSNTNELIEVLHGKGIVL